MGGLGDFFVMLLGTESLRLKWPRLRVGPGEFGTEKNFICLPPFFFIFIYAINNTLLKRKRKLLDSNNITTFSIYIYIEYHLKTTFSQSISNRLNKSTFWRTNPKNQLQQILQMQNFSIFFFKLLWCFSRYRKHCNNSNWIFLLKRNHTTQ